MRIIATFILISSLLFVTGLIDYSPLDVPVEQPNVKSDWIGLLIAVALILLPILIYKFNNRKPKEILENFITKNLINSKYTFFFKIQWQY